MELTFKNTGSGFPLVILHGVFGSGDNWLTVSKLLSEHFNIILPDQRNHGRSPWSDEFTYQAMANDLHELVLKLGFPKIHLLGHSMGGKVAMKFATLYPELIDHLIVVDIAPHPYPAHHGKILEALTTLNLDHLTSRSEAENHLAILIPDNDTRQFLLKNLYRNAENKFAWRINLPVIDREIENVGEGLPANSKIDLPTLFIRGGKSWYVSDADIAEIHTIFTRASVETIATAGHWVQAEQPVLFSEAVLKFLPR